MSSGAGNVGPYVLLGKLGEGDYGEVHRAQRIDGGPYVALKVVQELDEQRLRALRLEVVALQRLPPHPAVVRVIEEDVSRLDGLPWYAMELLEGQTLRSYWGRLAERSSSAVLTPGESNDTRYWTERAYGSGVDRQPGGDVHAPGAGEGGPPVEEALRIAAELCDGLALIHGHGIVHRDLKPDNVVIGVDGRVVMVDFGLMGEFGGGRGARERLEIAGLPVGSPWYMSPEQVAGDLVDARSDLYSLGCIIYELVAGRPPFVGPNTEDVLQQHLEMAPAPPSTHRRGLRKELDELVLMLLRKDPHARPGHAYGVLAALARLGVRQDGRNRPRAPSYLYRARLAGRAAEVGLLRSNLQDLRDHGRGGPVIMGGPAGIGKTRLLNEFVRVAAKEYSQLQLVLWDPLEGVSPVQSLVRVIVRHCVKMDLHPGEHGSTETGSVAWKSETDRIFGRWGPVLAALEPAVARLPGQAAHPPSATLPAKASEDRLLHALIVMLREYVNGAGLVLVWDDLHRADAISLKFLGRLLRQKEHGVIPVLAVGAFRQEEAPEELELLLRELDTVQGRHRTDLGGLDSDALGELAADMLAVPQLPASLQHALAKKSQGNPFFVAAYFWMGVTADLLRRDEASGKWEVGDEPLEEAYQRLPMPAQIQDVLRPRVDAIQWSSRLVLEVAATLGNEFPGALLEKASDVAPQELAPSLNELRRKNILDASSPDVYRFSHGLIREFVYGCIPPHRRPLLHRSCAEAMESLYGDSIRERLAELGRHWELGGEEEKARERYLVGARWASDRYAYEEAEHLYREFLRMRPPGAEERIGARIELGEKVLELRGRGAEALGEYGEALREAAAVRLTRQEARCLRAIGAIHSEEGREEEARMYHERAVERADQTDDVRLQGLALSGLAVVEAKSGRLGDAARSLEEALAKHRMCGDTRSEVLTLCNLANVRRLDGQGAEARAFSEQAWEAAGILRDRRLQAIVMACQAAIAKEEGELDRASYLYEGALVHARAVGDRRLEASTLASVAQFQIGDGHLDEARGMLAEALEISEEVSYKANVGAILHILAQLELVVSGNEDRAAALGERAARFLSEDPFGLAELWCWLGHLRLSTGGYAGDFMERARSIGERLGKEAGHRVEEAIAKLERAQAELEGGRPLICGQRPEDVNQAVLRWLLEHRGEAIPQRLRPGIAARVDMKGDVSNAS